MHSKMKSFFQGSMKHCDLAHVALQTALSSSDQDSARYCAPLVVVRAPSNDVVSAGPSCLPSSMAGVICLYVVHLHWLYDCIRGFNKPFHYVCLFFSLCVALVRRRHNRSLLSANFNTCGSMYLGSVLSTVSVTV